MRRRRGKTGMPILPLHVEALGLMVDG